MKTKIAFASAALSLLVSSGAFADETDFFWELPRPSGREVLAPRDDYGKLHQMPDPNATDFKRRYRLRAFYYLMGSEQLITQPSYVGALQRDLTRLGYYCGEIDGIFGPETSDAIARLQKNYSMRVTGTLTVGVRRALFLP